ncbi:MAG TPA: reverse transcriptase domain-containing protein, partial [Planctomycetaceae bacterium]|nr:reverse transcriptase domain-containing protein [Planctomycetaceae bacterium]
MSISGSLTNRYAQPRLQAGRRPRREREPYQATDPERFDLSKFADSDNIYVAFQELVNAGGHGAGIDGFRPEHFSDTELSPILRQVSMSLTGRSYQAYPTRRVEIPKSATKVRTLALQRFTDRAVAKALTNCLTPFWEPVINRRSVGQIYAQLDREIRRRQIYVLAIDDIKDCFPNAPRSEVLFWHRHYIGHEVLLDLIERIILGHDGQGQLTGLDQGSPSSPVAIDVLLYHILDIVLGARSRNTPQFRYVDNLTYLCRDVHEAANVLSIARELVERSGFRLKGTDGEPQDLRDPGYDRIVLGLIPRWQNGRLSFSIPQKAFDILAEGLRYANEAERPSDNALRRCQGWLHSLGPALTNAVTAEVVNRVVDMARLEGFRNVTRRDMFKKAERAR